VSLVWAKTFIIGDFIMAKSDCFTVNWTRELPTEPGDYLYSSALTKGVTVLTTAFNKQGVLVCTNAKKMTLAEFSEVSPDGMWSSSKIEVPN
jgi:hypothetical protein